MEETHAVDRNLTFGRLSRGHGWAFVLLSMLFLSETASATSEVGCDTATPTSAPAFTIQPAWAAYIVIVLLVCLSALFSGLTLGLLSLDMNGLKIVMGSGDPKQAKLAKAIAPVRANGNLLLCTLLLGNVAVNALLSILMADLTDGLIGFLASTFVIVIFGEIIPQSTCSRYPLEIGHASLPLVKLFMVALFVLTKPLAMLLDYALGKELGTIYSQTELLTMLKLHEESNVVDRDQSKALEGALKYKDMLVSEVMTGLEATYMVPHHATLSFALLREIFRTGFSRIPVYGPGGRSDIVGLLFVKDLIFVDPEDETPVKRFCEILGRTFEWVEMDATLGDVLQVFKKGRGHMGLVRGILEHEDGRDSEYMVKGIITLEDIVEAILGDEIIDETDEYVDMQRRSETGKVERGRTEFDFTRLDLLDSKLNVDRLTESESNAVAAHLFSNSEVFQRTSTGEALDMARLRFLVSNLTALTLKREGDGHTNPPPKDTLYRRGRMSTVMTLVLSGKLSVAAGKDGFRSEAGPWTVLASDALWQLEGTYLPDFTAFISTETVRCLQITHAAYAAYLASLSSTQGGDQAAKLIEGGEQGLVPRTLRVRSWGVTEGAGAAETKQEGACGHSEETAQTSGATNPVLAAHLLLPVPTRLPDAPPNTRPLGPPAATGSLGAPPAAAPAAENHVVEMEMAAETEGTAEAEGGAGDEETGETNR